MDDRILCECGHKVLLPYANCIRDGLCPACAHLKFIEENSGNIWFNFACPVCGNSFSMRIHSRNETKELREREELGLTPEDKRITECLACYSKRPTPFTKEWEEIQKVKKDWEK